MGLLADVFSYGDGLKRKMRGLLDDPAGTVDLGARRFNEDQGGLLNLFANAYPMGGDKTVLNTPEQRKQMQAEAAEKALEVYGGLLGATVWHGSPHKFDKFDSSKIGTGEGAQAYGHGLYLAESPGVAVSYRNTLSAKSGPQNDVVQSYIKEAGGDRAKAAKALKEYVGYDTKGPFALKAADRANVDEMLEAILNPPGSLYKVDLPDDAIAKMLDWDKPLSQQAPEVQKALGQSIDDVVKPYSRVDGSSGYWAWIGGQQKMFATKEDAMSAVKESYSGVDLLNVLSGKLNVSMPGPMSGNAKASGYLRDQGIPGIRYLDGGSRGAGGGTSNYVVFPGNEGLLKILERNGSPIP